jgi:hypothetical protein
MIQLFGETQRDPKMERGPLEIWSRGHDHIDLATSFVPSYRFLYTERVCVWEGLWQAI